MDQVWHSLQRSSGRRGDASSWVKALRLLSHEVLHSSDDVLKLRILIRQVSILQAEVLLDVMGGVKGSIRVLPGVICSFV